MSQCPAFAHRILGQGKSRLVCIDIECEHAAIRAVVLIPHRCQRSFSSIRQPRRKERRKKKKPKRFQRNKPTRLVALCSVHSVSFPSTRSPSEKGRELPFAIADATADFRKSIFMMNCIDQPCYLLLFCSNECPSGHGVRCPLDCSLRKSGAARNSEHPPNN